ncbi:MAG: DUF5615 family PIN-like protein [Caldilineaceae bacterium]
MKFLIDVNASGAVVQQLEAWGHDVAQVMVRDGRMKDEDILAWAVQEQRIVITTDQDFEEMIWRERRAHCGILRLENLPRRARIELLKDVLAQHSQALADGVIVIAMNRKIRIRRIVDNP